MESRFYDENKDTCVLYLLVPDEQEYIEFTNLLEQKYKINLIESAMELKVWMNYTNAIRPSLFITGLATSHNDIKKLMAFLSDTQFMVINEDIESNHGFESENGNTIEVYETYEEVIQYLRLDMGIYDEYGGVPNGENIFENTHGDALVNDLLMGDEDEGRIYVDIDSDEDEEIHPSLQKITEYNKDKEVNNNTAAIQNQSSPSSMGPEEKKHDNTMVQSVNLVKEDVPMGNIGNLYTERSRNVQRGLFTNQERENHRTIGIWSPLHRMGVTSLTMNFSMFLAHNRVDVAVVEGITSQFAMKDWLKRYTPIPSNWISCAKAIQTDAPAINSKWKYCNIMFLPLDKSDPQYEWNTLSLDAYMNTSKVKDIDVTLVDMPTGEMAHYTMDTISHLDELWIVVDDAIQETLAWKKYITELRKQTKLSIYLIFNKEYPFSQHKRVAKELGVDVITTIPSLHEETMKNYYENEPLYFQEKVQALVEVPYTAMATHLFGGNFLSKKDADIFNQRNWLKRLLAPFKIRTNH